MKTQAVLYHNIETDYLAGVVVVDVEGDKEYPQIIAKACEVAIDLAGGNKDKFISCLNLGDSKWEIRVDLSFTKEYFVDRFMQYFNTRGTEQ